MQAMHVPSERFSANPGRHCTPHASASGAGASAPLAGGGGHGAQA